MPHWLSRHKWLWVVALVTIAVLAFAACKSEKKAGTTPGAEGPLRIGLLVDFTGALSDFGPEQENAAKLAIKDINDAGGVLGQPVELVKGDSGTTPDIGVTEARRLVDIEKVNAIVGSLASGVTLAIAEGVTIPGKILEISPASTSPALTSVKDNDYLFRTPISDAAQGLVLAKLVKSLGFTKVCTMYVNNAYGQGLTENFKKAYEAAGGKVTAQVSHTAETATTYTSELNQCVAGSPDALVAISYPTGQADVYLREAIEGNLIKKFVFVDGTKSDDMFGRLGWANFDGMSGTAPGALPPSDFTTKFDQLYEQAYGKKFQQPFVHEAYDAVIAIALAAEKARSTDSTAIRDALRDVANAPGKKVASPSEGIKAALQAVRKGEDIDFDGASGSVEFDQNGDVTIGTIDTWHVDAANQKLVTDKSFKVDLKAGTVEELTTMDFPSTTRDFVADIDPTLLRAIGVL
ncbi:MAG TPA: ABC transporter substrate-binding protein [Dehalococcoidia bacterium]|nr:ABC transporter substrate-binding protein [Dehalococcoidia bacterium]